LETTPKNEICMYCKKGLYLDRKYFQQPFIQCKYWTDKIWLRYRSEDGKLGDVIPFTVGVCFWCPEYEEEKDFDKKWSDLAKKISSGRGKKKKASEDFVEDDISEELKHKAEEAGIKGKDKK
jgi:hypothetical protein